MSLLRILVFLVILFCYSAVASVDISIELMAFRNVQVDIKMEYLDKGRPPPSDIHEIPLITYMRNNLESFDVATLRAFNDLAIVTGSPQVELFQEGRKKIVGLVLVGRVARENTSGVLGRNIAYVSNNQISNTWIEEAIYKEIMSSIPDFDAMVQPLAFPELGRVIDERSEERNTIFRSEKKRIINQHQTSAQSKHPGGKISLLTLALTSIGALSVAWFICSKLLHRKSR